MTPSRPSLFDFVDSVAGHALVARAADMTRVVLLSRGPYASGLDEHVPAALMGAMVRAGAAHLLMESGHDLADAAALVAWESADLFKVFKRGRKGALGSLAPFVRDLLDAILLAVAPTFQIRPSIRFNRQVREYADLLADQTRLKDAVVEGLLRQAPTHPKPSSRRLTERETRAFMALHGRPARQRITLRELAAARLRGEVDERRIAYMDAFHMETSDGGGCWVVGMAVGREGVCHVAAGPEAGLVAQKLLLWFLRRYGRTFDVLVTDCHLAYREGSFTMLLLFMGIEHYAAVVVVDNDMERDIVMIRRVMLNRRLLHREKVLERILNGLSLPGSEAIEALRILPAAQLRLIEYDRFGTVEMVDNRLRLGDFSLPAPEGLSGVFSCGIVYQYPEDTNRPQLARFDIFRAPVPVDKSARFPRLLDGAHDFTVVASWTLHVNGVRGLRVTRQQFHAPVKGGDVNEVDATLDHLLAIAAEHVPKTKATKAATEDGPKQPVAIHLTQPVVDPKIEQEGGVGVEPTDSSEEDGAADLGLPGAPSEPGPVETPHRDKGSNMQPDRQQHPARPVIVLPGEAFPDEVVEREGQEMCDSIQCKRPYQFRAPSLRRNPDLCEAVEAEGKHARAKPVAIIFVTEEELRGDKARSVGGHLFDAGAVRLHDALPERLRFSFDHAMEDVDLARVAKTARETQRLLGGALAKLRALPIRPRSRAAHCRRDLAQVLESAQAAAGRGELLVARAYLDGVE